MITNCQFFVYLYLVKIRLEIMLNDFGYKKQNFLIIALFQKGITHAFGQKMPSFWLFRFGQNVLSALFTI